MRQCSKVLVTLVLVSMCSVLAYAACDRFDTVNFTNPPESQTYLPNAKIDVKGVYLSGNPPVPTAGKTVWIRLYNDATGALMAEEEVTSTDIGEIIIELDDTPWTVGAATLKAMCGNDVMLDSVRHIQIVSPPPMP